VTHCAICGKNLGGFVKRLFSAGAVCEDVDGCYRRFAIRLARSKAEKRYARMFGAQ
jgi:hypothetical protein